MKQCKACSGEMTSFREAYRYNESGLPNVILNDVEVRRCANCGAQEVPLPRVAELHRAIAMALVHKPARFLGAEVRFLRKYMGWSGVDFASRMGVNPETVSRWENEKEAISTISDRLLRLIVARGWPVEDYSVDDLVKIDHRRDPPPFTWSFAFAIATGNLSRRSFCCRVPEAGESSHGLRHHRRERDRKICPNR